MNPTTTRLRATSIPLLVLTFVLSALTLVLLPASPAAAHSHCGAMLCEGGTIPQNPGGTQPNDPDPGLPGGGGDDDDGGGGNGGYTPAYEWNEGGQGFFPSRPPGQIGGRGGSWTDSSGIWRYGGQCDGNYSWSANGRTYSEPYIGWRWYLAGTYRPPFIGQTDVDPDMPVLKEAIVGGYECIPPPKYYEYQITCATWADGYLDGPFFGGSTPPSGTPRTNFPRKFAAWNADKGNVAKCQGSWSFTFGATPTSWGRYTLSAEGWGQVCTRRVYYSRDQRTGSVPTSQLLNCSAPEVLFVSSGNAELYCQSPYWDRVFSDNWTYTSDDCGDPGGPGAPQSEWSCGPQVDRNPTFVGRRTFPAPVMDDGKARRASWEQPQPSGNIRNIRNKETRLVFREGSPFRPGEPRNGDTQPFLVDPKNNSTWTQGWEVKSSSDTRSAWDLSFFAAGNAGDPWKARPIWQFDADFRFMLPTLTMNVVTGEVTATLTPTWVEQHFVCRGQDVEVDVHRARNSSN